MSRMCINNSALEYLQDYHTENSFTDREYVKAMAEELSSTLEAYKVDAKITDYGMTPFAVRFDVMPAPGTSVKNFKNIRTELELWMASPVEITSEGNGKYTISISVKSLNRPIIGLREIIQSPEFMESTGILPIAAGQDALGNPFVFDLAETPHLLIAGTTGSGKSVFINDIILSIMLRNSPDDVRFIMIDPKRVELGPYNGVPYLMSPVVYDNGAALATLSTINEEMRRRYNVFAEAGVRKLEDYNTKCAEDGKLPRIVIVIDEYMDMITDAPKELEELIASFARLGRASGIHLVLATQRPSSDVITGSIKANIPCRASFTVVDWRESKTILDRTGAERLLGSGDMLYSTTESSFPIHAQASFVSEDEIDAIISYFKGKV